MRFHHHTLRKFQKSTPEPIKENFEDEIMSFFIHVADLSGATKKYDLSQIWAKKINKEFTDQYEAETKFGIPQTAHFKGLDDEYIFHKNECGFRKFIILPLYDTMKKLDQGFFRGQRNQPLKVVHQIKGIWMFELIIEEDLIEGDKRSRNKSDLIQSSKSKKYFIINR